MNSNNSEMTLNELETPHNTNNTSDSRPSRLDETVYNEYIYNLNKSKIGTKKLAVNAYSESIPKLQPLVHPKPVNINIKKSIDILTNYIRIKDKLDTEHQLGHLKDAVEEIEKEIEEVQRVDGGVRRNKRRTYKKVARKNKTRARK
jgi:hypothetical protein